LVEELRLQPLQPGRALIDQRLPQTHACAQLDDVRGRDPGLGQLTCEQQPQLQLAVTVVGLRALLATAPRCRFGRIGETSDVPGTLELLDHEPPTGRPLEHKLALDSRELLQPFAQRPARGRTDPAAPALPAHQVERLESDLPAVHIQRAYDLHRDLLELQVLNDPRALPRLRRGGPTTCHLCHP
jgi:hypothetical protein